MDQSDRDTILNAIRLSPLQLVICALVGVAGGVCFSKGLGAYVAAAAGLSILWSCGYALWMWRGVRRLRAVSALVHAEVQADVDATYAGVRRDLEDVRRASERIEELSRKITRYGGPH